MREPEDREREDKAIARRLMQAGSSVAVIEALLPGRFSQDELEAMRNSTETGDIRVDFGLVADANGNSKRKLDRNTARTEMLAIGLTGDEADGVLTRWWEKEPERVRWHLAELKRRGGELRRPVAWFVAGMKNDFRQERAQRRQGKGSATKPDTPRQRERSARAALAAIANGKAIPLSPAGLQELARLRDVISRVLEQGTDTRVSADERFAVMSGALHYAATQLLSAEVAKRGEASSASRVLVDHVLHEAESLRQTAVLKGGLNDLLYGQRN